MSQLILKKSKGGGGEKFRLRLDNGEACMSTPSLFMSIEQAAWLANEIDDILAEEAEPDLEKKEL